MSANRPFFVGIGAQKSGTTWISRYLSTHPEAALPPFKECHYWTSKYTRHQRWATQSPGALRRRLPQLFRAIRREPSDAVAKIAAFAGMLAHRDASYRRFLELFGQDARISGEITPSYATLPLEGVHAIETCLDRPRYFLVLRNPADRFGSQISHEMRFDPGIRGTDPLELLARPAFALRSNYAVTLSTFLDVVEPERMLVLFYEHLFDPERGPGEIERLCTFLGIAPRPADLGRRINASTGTPPEFDRADVVGRLRSSYDAVFDRFGEDVPRSWREDMGLPGAARS